MVRFNFIMCFIGVVLMSASDPASGDAGGFIFGIMVVMVSALVVVSEAYRKMDAITYIREVH